MKRETRVHKYEKLRQDIENIDDNMLKDIQDKKFNVVKESMKHCGSNTTNDKNQSIEQILEGHSKYVNLENYHGFDETKKIKKYKKYLIVGIGLMFIVVITILIITIIGR